MGPAHRDELVVAVEAGVRHRDVLAVLGDELERGFVGVRGYRVRQVDRSREVVRGEAEALRAEVAHVGAVVHRGPLRAGGVVRVDVSGGDAAEDADVGDLVFADAVFHAVAERDLAVAEVVGLVVDRAVDEQRDDRAVAERGEDVRAVLRREHFDAAAAGREAGGDLRHHGQEEERGRGAAEERNVTAADAQAQREEGVTDEERDEREERDARHAVPGDPVRDGFVGGEAGDLGGRERAGVDRVVVRGVLGREEADVERRRTDEIAVQGDADLGAEDGVRELDARDFDGAERAGVVHQLDAERGRRLRESVGGTGEIDRAVGPVAALRSHVVDARGDDVGVLTLHDEAVLGDGRDRFEGVGVLERHVRHVHARLGFGVDRHRERHRLAGGDVHRGEFVVIEGHARGVEVEDLDDRLHADRGVTVVDGRGVERQGRRGFDVRTRERGEQRVAVCGDADRAREEVHERRRCVGVIHDDRRIHPAERAALGRENLHAEVVATGGHVRQAGSQQEGFAFVGGQRDRRAHHVERVGESVFLADAAQFQAVLQACDERLFRVQDRERSGDGAVLCLGGNLRHVHRLGFVGVREVDRFRVALAVRLRGLGGFGREGCGRVERHREQ